MSFDVYIESPKCSHCKGGGQEVYSFNLTHNVNEIVERCLVSGGASIGKSASCYADRSWGRLHGHTVAEVLPVVRFAQHVSQNREREAEFLSLQPGNGWGSLAVVRRVMAEFLEALEKAPSDYVIETSG